MCGHIGFFTTEKTYSFDRKKIFQQGLYADTLRGDDSTGIALLKHKKPTIYKKALAGYDFINSRQFDKVFDKNFTGATIGMGHNRAATKGFLIDDNAHPFQHNNIILAHNGTLTYSTWNKPDKYDEFSVDSEFICHSIATLGVEKTIPLLQGSFALVWIDMRDRSLNLVRNSQRELHFAHLDDEETTIYGSEPDMLRWLASRNDIKIKENKVWELQPGQWIKFTNKSYIKYRAKEVKLYTYTSTYSSKNTSSKTISTDGAEEWLARCLYVIGDEVIFKPDQIRPKYFESSGRILEATLNNAEIQGMVYGTEFKTIQDVGMSNKYKGKIDRVFTTQDYYNAPKKLTIVLKNIKVMDNTIVLPSSQYKIKDDVDEDHINYIKEGILYDGPAGCKLTEKELDELFRETGCRCCGDPIEYGDIIWTDDGDPACKPCSESKEWQDFFTLANASGNIARIH